MTSPNARISNVNAALAASEPGAPQRAPQPETSPEDSRRLTGAWGGDSAVYGSQPFVDGQSLGEAQPLGGDLMDRFPGYCSD